SQSEQQTEAQACNQPFDEDFAETGALDHNAFAQRKDGGGIRRVGESDFPRVWRSGGQFHALREGGDIYLDLVSSLDRNSDGPGSVFSGGRLAAEPFPG